MQSNSRITYSGNVFSYSNVNTILSGIWKMLEDDGCSISCIKRIYSVSNECLENICRHTLKNYNVADSIIFSIEKENERYVIEATNPMRTIDSNALKEKVSYLNSLNESELKELYQKGIKSSEISNKGGAGLGLTIIARKAEKLDISITKIDENVSLVTFLIAVTI